MKIIKLLTISILITSSLYVNAEYTAKIFLEGISMKNEVSNPPEIIKDGDETVKNGGEDGELKFKVSRTSGYNHNKFILTVESNSYNCFKLEYPDIYNYETEDCYDSNSYPIDIELETYDFPVGVSNLKISGTDDYNGVKIKSYDFSVELLPIDNDSKSDSDLSFGYYRKVVDQGSSFSYSIKESTFDCYRINVMIPNYGYYEIDGSCSNETEIYGVVDLYGDLYNLIGEVEFSIEGFNEDPINYEKDNKFYPFIVTINEVPELPEIEGISLHTGSLNYSFGNDYNYFGKSFVTSNHFEFYAGKSKEYKVEVPSLGFSTGWLNINYYSDSVTEYGVGDSIKSKFGGVTDLTITVRNGVNTASKNESFNLNPTGIKNVQFQMCSSGGWNCEDYPDQKMIIESHRTEAYPSLTFRADNTDCMRLQSFDDPEYNTPKTKCYYNGSEERNANFNLMLPNHDPAEGQSKVYTYNYEAIQYKSDEFTIEDVVRGSHSITISY